MDSVQDSFILTEPSTMQKGRFDDFFLRHFENKRKSFDFYDWKTKEALLLHNLYVGYGIIKKKKGLVDCMLFGIYFFLSINAPTIAIAMIIAIATITR